MIRRALFTTNTRRGLRASGLGMARPAALVEEVGFGERLVADGAGTMSGVEKGLVLNRVGEVQVAVRTGHFGYELDMARPAALVAEVECGEQLAADGAGTMSGLEMAVVLNRVGEVQVAETTVHLGMAIDVVGAQAVSVVELDKILAVPAAKVAG